MSRSDRELMKTLLSLSFALFLLTPAAFARRPLVDIRPTAQTGGADNSATDATSPSAATACRHPSSGDQVPASVEGFDSLPSTRITQK
ncbi:MAG: hypothetical protein ABIR96_07155 [Bdellovibrionota bacterium]